MTALETLLVGQSGGPTPVINASLAGVIEGARGRFRRILGLRHGIEGALAGQTVDLTELADADLRALRRTPAAALGSCRHKLDAAGIQSVVSLLRSENVRAFAYIGGNDSMDTCARLGRAASESGWPLAVYGVPKTIDNDLVGTDHCPGYGSAARYWAISTQEATRDLAAMRTYDRVLILECAGRNAGWLAASTALYRRGECDGPHVLLVPERSFNRDAFLSAVEEAVGRVGYCVVAAAETIRDAGGAFVAQSVSGTDRFGHAIVTAVGETLAQLVGRELQLKARANKPGTFQRTSMAYASPVDQEEAFQAGRAAVERLADKESGRMVAFARRTAEPYACDLASVALDDVANSERRVPDDFLLEEDGVVTGLADAFRAYALPLLGPAPEPHFSLA
ncbi:MAG TPA: diphosphate--fructose-6-phosphate 1-phosphotransferase [Chloroflexota bacterium]|nr:diphosphate--fructose-6-phosphate 1-phosphotransferase [Chloroflexota bacterium]